MKLIINIPAYNEGEVIGKTIKSIPREFDGIDEVLIQVIDDGSKDDTAKISREAGADIVVSHTTNRRLGVVFNTAVESALKNSADFMVNIDADGQFDVNEIKNVLAPVVNNKADMVIGDRFNKGKAHDIPFVKSFFNKLGAKLVGTFLSVKTYDLTCGFRAHNRETLLRLNQVSGFTYTQETIIDAIGKNLKLKWVPITVRYFEGRKSRIVKSVFSFVNNSAKIIIKAVRDVRPMKFFGIPGIILISFSAVFFVIFLSFYLQNLKISPYINYLLASITLFLVGLQFFVFALIADMIKSNRKLTEDQMYLMKKDRYNKS
ncbi:MAG: glycosyltransferase family 2 protein [Candidatus Moranbacteria bacterium]|nr:glycosyltransferase family 2 protein [Candidatus Moranbacteria bacterium]